MNGSILGVHPISDRYSMYSVKRIPSEIKTKKLSKDTKKTDTARPFELQIWDLKAQTVVYNLCGVQAKVQADILKWPSFGGMS